LDDLVKNLTLGLFALASAHVGIEERLRHDAARQVREMFHNTGLVRVTAEPRGAFGLIASDAWSVDIYGEHLKTERMPFVVYPKSGWKGSIRHLRLHLDDFTLAGLPIAHLDADVPFVKFDIGEVTWKDRIVLRGAGSGPAAVQVNAAGLRHFVIQRYTQTLSDVELWFQNRKLYLSGKYALFGVSMPFIASGHLSPRAGRYVDVTDAILLLNHRPVSPQVAETILRQINPVLDIERDLGLGNTVTMTDVEIGDSEVTIHGQATIPPASASPPAPLLKERGG
jgi:hypothetical protein